MLVVFACVAVTLMVAFPVPLVMPLAVTVNFGMLVFTVAVVVPPPLAVAFEPALSHMSLI